MEEHLWKFWKSFLWVHKFVNICLYILSIKIKRNKDYCIIFKCNREHDDMNEQHISVVYYRSKYYMVFIAHLCSFFLFRSCEMLWKMIFSTLRMITWLPLIPLTFHVVQLKNLEKVQCLCNNYSYIPPKTYAWYLPHR